MREGGGDNLCEQNTAVLLAVILPLVGGVFWGRGDVGCGLGEDPPGQLALPVGAPPGVPVFLQRPHVRQPQGQRALHDLALGARRLALPAVVALSVEARVVALATETRQGEEEEGVSE